MERHSDSFWSRRVVKSLQRILAGSEHRSRDCCSCLVKPLGWDPTTRKSLPEGKREEGWCFGNWAKLLGHSAGHPGRRRKRFCAFGHHKACVLPLAHPPRNPSFLCAQAPFARVVLLWH